MYLYAGLVQGSDLVEKIEDPSIIDRVGYIQANDM
jgi:hypothetical protein